MGSINFVSLFTLTFFSFISKTTINDFSRLGCVYVCLYDKTKKEQEKTFEIIKM